MEMKTKTLFLVLTAGCLLAGTACDNDDNYLPDETVVSAFNSKYPNAKRIEWENKKGYKVADFTLDAKEAEAWFDDKGNWLLTETDIPFNALPMAIQSEFVVSPYGTWHVEDVDVLTRPDAATVYVVEVEKGEQEIDLYYAEDGTLLKEVKDGQESGYEPTSIPAAVLEKLTVLYPQASILEYDREGVYLEIDIRDGGVHKEVLFDSNNNWVSTEWDVLITNVPAVVTNALKMSEYASYKIDDVEIREMPEGLFFVFELESGDKEVSLTVKDDGTIA